MLASNKSLYLLGLSLVLCHQMLFVISIDKQDQDDVCRPFNKSSGLAELCGYDSTAKFVHDSDDFLYASYLRGGHFVNCSKTVRLLLCSHRFPRCVADVQGPFLPCKRVALDTLSRCGEEMQNKGFDNEYWWIKWYKNLLPENNDPTSKNFKKRCFEPPNFKTDVKEGDLEPNKCFPLVVPECHNHGYKFTIFPEKYQKKLWESLSHGPPLKNTTVCDKMAARWFCTNWFPPCYNGFLGSICKEECQDYNTKNCSSPLLTVSKEMCGVFSKGSSSSICKWDEWIYARNWPGALTGASFPQKASVLLTIGGLMISYIIFRMLFMGI